MDAQSTNDVVACALNHGINFFDTADVYGDGISEEYLGNALKGRRHEALIATKFGKKLGPREPWDGPTPDYICKALDDSLRRLRTGHVDLYQLHKPDPRIPIGETLSTLNKLVTAGKVREIGCSNFSVAQLREASAAATAGSRPFVCLQNEYSLLHREPENGALSECERNGAAFVPYFPLANGLLTGKYLPNEPFPKGSRADTGFGPKVFKETNLALAKRLGEFAKAQGHTLLELAFSWLLSRPVVASVVAGAVSTQQMLLNASAFSWRLTDADLTEVDRILLIQQEQAN